MWRRILPLVMMACALGAAPPLAAQTIFKSTMPDGKVIYGEKPAPGATRSEEIRPPPRASGISPVAPGSSSVGTTAQRDPAAVAQAQADLAGAEAKLREAQEAAEKGKEPLPGERSPGAGGKGKDGGAAGRTSFLNDAYWARQKQLERAIDETKREVERLRQEAGVKD